MNPSEVPSPALNPGDQIDPMRKVSDKFDGADEAFHVVAVTRQEPAGATVEAFFAPSGAADVRVGTLRRLGDSPDTWELFWEIPDDFPQGAGDFKVKMFNRSGAEIGADAETVEVNTEEETVEILAPGNDDRLGFFKPKDGEWRTAIDGTASPQTSRIYAFYSVTPIGVSPEWKNCNVGTTTSNFLALSGTGESRPFQFSCALNPTEEDKDLPSQVTGFAIVATESDNPVAPGGPGVLTQESADIHRVRGFAQDPHQTSVSIVPVQSGTTSAAYPSPQHREKGTGCLVFDALVVDQFDRPVVGASVDVHLVGPDDDAGFGVTGSSNKFPDKGSHEREAAYDCAGERTEFQGEHQDPDGPDVKHRESLTGTGLSPAGVSPGAFRFSIFSPTAGIAQLTAWVDDRQLANESGTRELDSDTLGEAESSGTLQGYWLAGPAKLNFIPNSATALTGTCQAYSVSVRGGRSPVPGVNVDVHATGPNNDLDFCNPGGSSREAPELGEHQAEDAGEAQHPSEDPEVPNTQHSEGQTDDTGQFVIGLTSPVDGETTLQGWVDGLEGQDNDVRATAEVTGTGTTTWASSVDDATIRFVNPSGYADDAGNNVSNKLDVNNFFHVVTRVDLPNLIDGVDILISSDGGASFSKLPGEASRVGTSDTWEYQWVTDNIDAGSYVLRAQIRNTERFEDREIEVDNDLNTLDIASPANNASAPFVERETTVTGTASADAEGVAFYYTKTAPRDTRDAEQWTQCGAIELPAAEEPQPFEGQCALAEDDQASAVTGIAAITTFCDPIFGCNPDELGSTTGESGDAHRVIGTDSTPVMRITPQNGEGGAGSCQRIVVDIEDETGQPIGNENVDVHLQGPIERVHFCTPDAGGSDRDGPEEGGHTVEAGEQDEAFHQGTGVRHTEGTTGPSGRFIFGITSRALGRSTLTVWLDRGDNDELDSGEETERATFRWVKSTACTKTGTAGDNVIVGTPGPDRLCGLGGNDVIDGKGGNDVLIGGGGRDILRGNNGRDRASGGGGRDTLIGGGGNDVLSGGGDNDILSGKAGRDSLRGRRGNDNLDGGRNRDSCVGGSGRDRFRSCENQRQ